jgi:hypothetical protein
VSSELVAIPGCVLALSAGTGTITIIPASVTSAHCKAGGQGIYLSISFTVAGYVGSGISAGTGAGVIVGTATKVLTDGIKPVREKDKVTITITDSETPFGSTTVDVSVLTAGQTKVKGV